MQALRSAAWLLAAAVVFAANAQAATLLAGCYERSYDAAHLAKHKGQIVTRARLLVKPSQAGTGFPAIDGILVFWVTGHKASFSTAGACDAKGGTLYCNGALSAAEVDPCKGKRDGVRDCREQTGDAGSFTVSSKGDGVLVTVAARLEVPESNEDAGPPFLYLDPRNAENHAFLLPRAADGICSSQAR
jgi:hypothetical protein